MFVVSRDFRSKEQKDQYVRQSPFFKDVIVTLAIVL